MKKAILLVIAVSISVCYAEAQSVKYKDLFFLLDTKKYDDAEPFLRQFLKEDKNADHPNANFQMAMVYQEKAKKNDVLLETDILTANIDSAIIFYRNALTYIDEKELKRNDEYYQAYKRRDIRTGKFGIKLADIQFDLEKKIEGLNEQKSKVSEVVGYHSKMEESYGAAQAKFKSIYGESPTIKALYLRADANTLKELEALKADYVHAVENFDKYKSSMGKITGARYDQSLIKREILDYKKDGQTPPDYRADIINFWDYGSWVEKSAKIMKDEIFPLREKVVAYDRKLTALEKTLLSDSLSVASGLAALSPKLIVDQLTQYDPEPLPVAVFSLRDAELKYKSLLIDHKSFRDSINLLYKLDVLNHSLNALNAMDSIVNILIGKNLQEESKNYQYFIETQFESVESFQSFVKSKLDYAIEQKRAKNYDLEYLVERSRWLIDKNDSIPLFKITDGKSGYVPLVIDEDRTTGLYYSDKGSVQGYFAKIDETRIPKSLVKFDLDKEYFNRENITNIIGKSLADESGHIYYVIIYAPKPEQEAYMAAISKIYSSDGLSWTKGVDLAAEPVNLLYDASSGNFIVDYNRKGINDTGTNGTLTPTSLILDKKGNIKE
ncbi:hypothetical protein LVD17_19970 [Fulvivirga ulvae]|uniref:hypothetical protein n=1 Tax=Fulvivirga ulvae TaxID=2904245 RepID=UPI001F218805|nr:hypothetical protein [Fulvivirga ulvae]UII30572.1 hypothetical protein LVD17_19970 [Fulvivirga ulvae]